MYRLAVLLIILGGIAGGCAHPAGYVDVHTSLTPLNSPPTVTRITAENPIRIARDITPESAILEVRLESLEITSRLHRRAMYGKPIEVKYTWYAPILKPITAVTVVTPFYLALHDPHRHKAGPWRRRDYLRDVISWFNPFSAVPTGPKSFSPTERLISSEVLDWPEAVQSIPVPSRTVTLRLDGKLIGRAVTDDNGTVRFDLAPNLNADMAQKDQVLQLSCSIPGGMTAELDHLISAQKLQRLVEHSKQP